MMVIAGLGVVATAAGAIARATVQAGSGMAAMPAGHMHMTELRPLRAGDQKRADEVVAEAKVAMQPYTDYHKALDAGYKIFLPNLPQKQYHFTNAANAWEARNRFDPLKPTSLLYKKTASGGYELVGVMYTDRVDASEQELDQRIPLSIAEWHQHVNFRTCLAGWCMSTRMRATRKRSGLSRMMTRATTTWTTRRCRA
jgi:hypothetical protein